MHESLSMQGPEEMPLAYTLKAPITRRGFLTIAATSALSLLATDPAVSAPQRQTRLPLIVLFLSGGVSAKESFNPDPTVLNNGCAVPVELRGPLGSIATRTGNRFSEVFPQLAARSDRFALIRSLDAGTTDHTPGQQNAILRGRTTITEQIGERAADGGVGYVLLNPGSTWNGLSMAFRQSSAYAPAWQQTTATFAAPPAQLESDAERARLAGRQSLLGSLQRSSSMADTQETNRLRRFQETAFDLARGGGELLRATTLNERDRVRYGSSLAGDMALMAKQFVERGAGSATVYYEPEGLTFDLHSNIEQGMRTHGAAVDAAAAALIDDIGRSAREYVVYIIGEINRTPRINSSAGRDHWRHGNCAILAGGKAKPGAVIGSTNHLGDITRDPVRQQGQLTNTVLGACSMPLSATESHVAAALQT